tara:strand:- start:281 stop:511 length:231 start_codon:yes stop_codon:yes gene_type:complete
MKFHTFYNKLATHLPKGKGYKTNLYGIWEHWEPVGLCEEFIFSFKQGRKLGLDYISSVDHAYLEWDLDPYSESLLS